MPEGGAEMVKMEGATTTFNIFVRNFSGSCQIGRRLPPPARMMKTNPHACGVDDIACSATLIKTHLRRG
jgi:hypothetical protein